MKHNSMHITDVDIKTYRKWNRNSPSSEM